jgi:hypothetical protein
MYLGSNILHIPEIKSDVSIINERSGENLSLIVDKNYVNKAILCQANNAANCTTEDVLTLWNLDICSKCKRLGFILEHSDMI